MGWRGALRTVGAIARESDRNARRQARVQARHFAALDKAEQQERAAEVVSEFQSFLKSIVSIHITCSRPIDWTALATVTPPTRPEQKYEKETTAREKLTTYSPSVFARLFGLVERKKQVLADAIPPARLEDESDYAERLKVYEQKLTQHEDEVDLAKRMLARDTEAMIEFLKESSPLVSIPQLGEHVTLSIPFSTRIGVELDVQSEEVIPKEIPKLLASGKLSVKVMPKGEFYRIYQDHVCSATLRVAREMLAVLPVDTVVVTAVDTLLDSSTGNRGKQAILSILAPRSTIDQLNFASLDPSDAMRNFVHRMDFGSTVGFRPIQPLDSKSADLSA